MTGKRTATLVFVGGGLIACVWLAAGATSVQNAAAPAVSTVRATRLDDHGAALAEELARLHDRLRPSTIPRQPGRNLFSFQHRASAAAAPTQAPPAAALKESNAIKPPAPRIKLSGIAEDTTGDGIVRTAIVSAFGQLFVVKEGESITTRYRVEKISSDVLELSDQQDGSILRVALP
jgi:hypothetical protein